MAKSWMVIVDLKHSIVKGKVAAPTQVLILDLGVHQGQVLHLISHSSCLVSRFNLSNSLLMLVASLSILVVNALHILALEEFVSVHRIWLLHKALDIEATILSLNYLV